MLSRRWLGKLKHWKALCLAYVGSFAAKFALKLILMTCRVRFVDSCGFTERSRKGGCVLLLWHNRIALVHHYLWKQGGINLYTLVVSASRDGRLLSGMTMTNPYSRVIQVPAKRRHHALKEMVQALKRKEVLLVTPDGPRGPRYEVKPGALYAAQSADAELIPFSYSVSRFWQLKSWDRMIIPKPFSKIVVGVGQALAAPEGEAAEAAPAYSEALRSWDRTLSEQLGTSTP